jgi:outer membrane protein OmpA-like peptidoglycan-associated protein
MRRSWCLLLLLLLSACAGPRERVVLLAVTDPGGQLTVQTPIARLTLDTAYQTAQARPSGRLDPGITTAEIVQARYGLVLQATPEAGRLFTLYFQTGATTLTPESQAEVPALLAEVARRGVCEVELTGHTDQTGTDDANDALALARAEAVRALLVAQGLEATFVRVVGRGARAPLVDVPGEPNATNRRVEVLVR